VFPDANLVPIHQTLQAAEERGFEVRDLENLREHYAQTVHCWLKNLARNREAILHIAGDETYRVFELYLSGFLDCFHDARIFLFQALLSKNRERRPAVDAQGLVHLKERLAREQNVNVQITARVRERRWGVCGCRIKR